MKKIILSILFIFIFYSHTSAQEGSRKDPKDKIEALEKIKLLETLDMDEDTAIKFFTRRNEHQEKIKSIFDEMDGKRDLIKNKVSSAEDENDPEFKKLLDSYFVSQQKIDEERKRFINSLSDILTYKQIAQLTLFERRFREEIRDILFPPHKKGKRLYKEQY